MKFNFVDLETLVCWNEQKYTLMHNETNERTKDNHKLAAKKDRPNI